MLVLGRVLLYAYRMTKAKVLIVEDEKDLRDIYQVILAANGYDVRTAKNGREGLEATAEFKPSIILLDIFMPVMDGKEMLQNIHLTEYPDMKIIVCSNTSDNKLMNEMMSLGAASIATKADLGPQELAKLIATFASK
jgi:DNA-binding NtrC family response regulator